jgi:opacity protein-like surface antigen
MRKVSLLLLVAALVAAVPAHAQDKRVDVNLGAGYTFALSDVKDHLGNGYNINLGVTIWGTEMLGFQAEYSFNGLGQKQITISQPNPPIAGCPPGGCSNITSGPFYADMNMQYGNFNLVVRPPVQGAAHPYFIAGVGVYYRPVKVTTPSVGYVPGYCDPWWYYCVPGGWVPVDAIVGSRSSTDFGMDFGAGVNVKLGDSVAVYVEGRYHYIWGPSYKDQSGNDKKATGQFFPITFGLRF